MPGKQQWQSQGCVFIPHQPKSDTQGLHCMAPGCTNYSKKIPNVHYHRLPLGDASLVRKWLGRMKLARPPKLQYSCVLISLMKTTRQRFILIWRVGDLFLSRPAIWSLMLCLPSLTLVTRKRGTTDAPTTEQIETYLLFSGLTRVSALTSAIDSEATSSASVSRQIQWNLGFTVKHWYSSIFG